jgi:4-diphosphocytidyl-2-C-methyl-D-erythritol kinase
MIRGTAFSKINLGLRVGRVRDDGFHPIDGIFQSVTISDTLSIETAEVDSIASSAGRQVPDGLDNLAFRAVAAVRDAAGSDQPIAVTLDKTIPAAAGLAGGSADAAAALAMAGRIFGIAAETLRDLAPRLGSDVPFCLHGGTARVTGRGERIERLAPLSGFSFAVVVPPFELATPAVFRQWDEMGEPEGLKMSGLPPSLRGQGDLINDLYAAAVALRPALDDWRSDLSAAWNRPVALSGSGPALYGFFLDSDEAEDALAVTPTGARLAEACDLSPVGWSISS